MKKALFFAFAGSLLFACNNTATSAEEKTETAEAVPTTDYQYYGDTIDTENAIESNKLYAMLEKSDSVAVKVQGKINGSCKMKGCWMKMDMGNGEEMHVTFKDYGFFVPTNLDGETAIIDGYATIDTISVADQKHLAMDGGKSEEEIAAINEPKVTLAYVATGVIIKE